MANYYASARSNYFRVKDSQAFEKWVESIPELGIFTKQDDESTLYAIYDDGGDSCGWPSMVFDEEGGDYRDIDLTEELAEHLVEGEVAVLIEVGAEKLRYLVGNAVAVRSDGAIIHLNLNTIYQMVEDQWGIVPTEAHY